MRHYGAPCCCRREHLTEREIDVLSLVADGRTNTEIGEILNLSPHTVVRHMSSMLRKVREQNRVGLVVKAFSAGILFPGEHGPEWSGKRCL